jgi:hypothetical protein
MTTSKSTKKARTQTSKASSKTKPESGLVFMMVPISTLTQQIGVKNWESFIKFLKKKLPKLKHVLTSYTDNGIVLHANSPTGKRLGLLKELLVAAKVESQPEHEGWKGGSGIERTIERQQDKTHTLRELKKEKPTPPKKSGGSVERDLLSLGLTSK